MNVETISFARCFGDSLEAFKKYIGIAIGVFVVYSAISYAASAIPFIGQIWQLTGAFVLAGGYYLFFLNVIRSADPTFGDLFGQFGDFARWLGVGWLLVLYTFVAGVISAIPLGLLALIGLAVGKDSTVFPVLMGVGGFVTAVIFICIAIRWAFVYYAAAEEGLTAKAAIARSEELTAGIRPQVFAVTFVAALLGVAGVIALGVGVLFTMPLAQCIMTALYINAKALKSTAQGFETPIDPSAPTF